MSLEIMRDRFDKQFSERHPGMSPDTFTYREAWILWQEAYIAGSEDMLTVCLHAMAVPLRKTA